MRPLRPRYSKIDALTEELLAKYRIKGPAVPVFDIARGEGADIQLARFNNEVSGLLLRKDGAIIIGVERSQSPARQRFTVAHELGHLKLHPGRELWIDNKFRVNLRSAESSTAEDIEEVESNAFGAALLMPEQFLKKDISDLVLDVEDEAQIKALAKRYEVSAQAMTLRLINLITRARL